MALAERTWERVGERKRDRARLIESAELVYFILKQLDNLPLLLISRKNDTSDVSNTIENKQ